MASSRRCRDVCVLFNTGRLPRNAFKSPCLLWKTLTLIGALQPWFDESLGILQMLVGMARRQRS